MSNVLVVGDFGLDMYWIGEAKGISAEAPVPVVKHRSLISLPGMAANVAELLQSLGMCVSMIEAAGPHRPVKNRLITTSGVQLARWDIEDFCTPLLREDILSALSHNPEAIVVSDYGKGAVTQAVVEALVSYATTGGTQIYVDTKSDPFAWIGRNITLFPNEHEYSAWKEHYDWLPSVVHKQGGAGMRYLNYGSVVASIPSYARVVSNVCGAGDGVLAGWVKASSSFSSPTTRLALASATAALLVEAPFYNRQVTWQAVTERYEQEITSHDSENIHLIEDSLSRRIGMERLDIAAGGE